MSGRPSSIPQRALSAALSGVARMLGARVDGAGPMPAAQPPATSATSVRVDAQSVMDCAGPGCGAGSVFGNVGGAALVTPSLGRPDIDDVCTDQLMWRIVTIPVDHALSGRPTLSGETGELTPCVDWLESKGFFAEAKRAMVYARQYGGGGIVCLIDDGRPADEEVDLLAVRDVVGFYALPKWFLVPDGVGSSRVTAAWYGQRIGRPEHYYVSPSTALGAPRGTRSHGDLLKILAKSGTRFHRSRVIPWPYRDDMDLRLARWMPQWNGWGPGVVEACLAPFMARRSGALRLSAIMNSIIVNTMTMTDLEHRQSTPDLGAAVMARLEFVKACRDFMGDSLPIIATDPANKFASLSHNVSGIDKVIASQRQYLLDVVEPPAVILFGDSAGGMNGGDRQGELRTWAMTVKNIQESWVWTAGSFGGGLRQACLLAMACPEGPTGGRMDLTVRAEWPSILTDTEDDKASRRLHNSQARAQDRITLDLTPAAILRYDPTIRDDYPGLDVDEGPLPVVDPATPGARQPAGTTPAIASEAAASSTGTSPAPAVTTPGAVNEELAGEQVDAPPPPPVTIPDDIHTEGEIATALKMTRPALRKMLEAAGVRPYIEAMPGQRGGSRYSLGEAMEAWGRGAKARADSLRRGPVGEPLDAGKAAALRRLLDDGAGA